MYFHERVTRMKRKTGMPLETPDVEHTLGELNPTMEKD